jgi:hypothetical protein
MTAVPALFPRRRGDEELARERPNGGHVHTRFAPGRTRAELNGRLFHQAERFAYTECPICGLAQSSNNNCRRCNGELPGANQEAWDAAAFQAWFAEVEPDSEEERQQGTYDVRPHPQRDVHSQRWMLNEWTLEPSC